MGHLTTRRDFLKVVLAGSIGAGLLGATACSPAAPSPTAAPASGAAPTKAPATGGSKVVLDMWTHFAGKNLEVMNGLLEEFKKDNSDIDVKVSAYGSGEIGPKVLTAVAGGAPPDIFHAPGWVPADFAFNGVLAPLDDIVKLPTQQLKNFDGITIYNGKR
ncbi:MAG: extracellular solute-binding protein, partial [Dehalococcoidales bacterium]|nr:extracellular solute-binding protein [Dehalococcoidales bacterium]